MAVREWLEEMLESPKYEFPQFPVALSNLMMLLPEEAERVLRRRALTETLAGLAASLAEEAEHGLPRVTMLESEYLRVVTEAELAWVGSVVDDLERGRLTWDGTSLRAFAAQVRSPSSAKVGALVACVGDWPIVAHGARVDGVGVPRSEAMRVRVEIGAGGRAQRLFGGLSVERVKTRVAALDGARPSTLNRLEMTGRMAR